MERAYVLCLRWKYTKTEQQNYLQSVVQILCV